MFLENEDSSVVLATSGSKSSFWSAAAPVVGPATVPQHCVHSQWRDKAMPELAVGKVPRRPGFALPNLSVEQLRGI